MTPPSTFDRVRVLIAQLGEIDPADVSLPAKLRGFGIDSLRVFDLVMALEEAFAIQIELQDLEKIRTVADLVAGVDTWSARRREPVSDNAVAS
jgi:acyl carrier protein